MKRINGIVLLISIVVAFLSMRGLSQDSVDVTFRWNLPSNPFPVGVSVPGEFNGWNNTAWLMVYQGGTLWTRTGRLAVGGTPNPVPPSVPGAWQYKFYFAGASPWPNDPLNHHVNASDNSNSFIIVKDPTIYQFLPNQRTGAVTTDFPTISAYIFPKVGNVVDTSTISLDIDGTTFTGLGSGYNFSTKQFAFVPPTALSNGSHTVILQAGATLDTVNFVVATGGPAILPIPPYARHGVTLPSTASNDSTTFRLRVGGTNYVLFRIAPLGQPVISADALFMRKNTTTDDWWLNVSLPPGDYEYLYQTDNGTFVYDPFGRWNGTYGSRFSNGPAGLTADDYQWNTTTFSRPPLNKLCIYEMNVGEVAGGYYGLPAGQGRFSHLKDLMGYYDSLGINAIELMPINDYGLVGQSGHSWGYDLNSYFALEPGYGTPRDFKIFVDSAHAHGIAVIVDVVFNHLNDTAPLWQMQPNEATSPYFKLCSDLRPNEDQLCFFKDMDHWTPETQELIYEVLRMWIDQYKVDGFRYDYTQGIGWSVGQPDLGILGWAHRVDSAYGGQIYQIAEHLPESPALVFYSGLTGGWHDSFHDEVFDEARFRNTSLIEMENLVMDLGAYPGNDVPSSPSIYANRTEPVNATVNHDEQSLIYEMTTFQGVPLTEALLRDKLYATMMFTSLGIPMLWEGMEFSESRGWMNDNQKLSYRPVQFSMLATMRGQEHYAYYQALIRQRLHNPSLYQGVLRKLFRYNTEKTLVWGFEDSTTSSRVMAVANFSGAQQTITNVPWLAAGNWFDIWDQSVFVSGGTTIPSITIPAYSALVYSNIPDSILLDVRTTSPNLPTDFSLAQNYPNPFNPVTTISFEVPKESMVRLSVFDLLGREVTTLVNQTIHPGAYNATWDASGSSVSSGVFFARLVANGGEFVATKKMILMK